MQRWLQAQQAQLDQQAIQFQQLQAQPPAVSQNPSPPANPPAAAVAPSGQPAAPAAADAPPCTADPTPAGNLPPGIVFPFAASAADLCYPRAILGGQYRMMFNAANYDYHPQSIGDNQPSQAFINERLRLWLTVQTSDNVEAYVQTQMGSVLWGTNYDLPKTFTAPVTAPGNPNDQVGIMLRYGYLAYHDDCLGRVQAGIQPWQDSFSQTLFSSDWDFSVGGFAWIRKFPEYDDTQLKFGIFELAEGDAQLVDQSYLLTLDIDRPKRTPSAVAPTSFPTRAATRIPRPFSLPTTTPGTSGSGPGSGSIRPACRSTDSPSSTWAIAKILATRRFSSTRASP
jgi:hypothetical protein